MRDATKQETEYVLSLAKFADNIRVVNNGNSLEWEEGRLVFSTQNVFNLPSSVNQSNSNTTSAAKSQPEQAAEPLREREVMGDECAIYGCPYEAHEGSKYCLDHLKH